MTGLPAQMNASDQIMGAGPSREKYFAAKVSALSDAAFGKAESVVAPPLSMKSVPGRSRPAVPENGFYFRLNTTLLRS